MDCWPGLITNEMMFCFFSRATPTPPNNTSASGSCVMERLGNSTAAATVSNLHSAGAEEVETNNSTAAETHGQNEVAQIEHFAEQLVDHMAKDQQVASQNHPNNSSDHTFHPITTEGLQVKYLSTYIKIRKRNLLFETR